MDEDDIPLEQLRQASSVIGNDQMLTPLDPAIEFQFDSSEIFNFDVTDFDLPTFYENCLSIDHHSDATNASNAEESKTQLKDLSDIETIKKKFVDEFKDPLNTSETPTLKRPSDEVPSTCKKLKKSLDPNEISSSETEPENMYIVQCGYCIFHTVSLHNLRVHMRGHANMKEKKYKCYYCNFLTKKSYYLRLHGAYMHGTAYNCKFCAFKTYSNSKMMSHIRHIH